MKKIISVACFSLAALGFTATSALAANNAARTEAGSSSAVNLMQKDAIAINLMLASKKVISMAEWYENVQKITSAKTEQQTKSIYDSLVYIAATTPFYQ